jgi:hypothetical protein
MHFGFLERGNRAINGSEPGDQDSPARLRSVMAHEHGS